MLRIGSFHASPPSQSPSERASTQETRAPMPTFLGLAAGVVVIYICERLGIPDLFLGRMLVIVLAFAAFLLIYGAVLYLMVKQPRQKNRPRS